MAQRPSLLALFLLLSLAGGCSLAPERTPVAPVAALPDSFAVPGEAGDDGRPTVALDSLPGLRWWSAFQDPALERFVDTVLVSNLDLAEALTRVEEARALAGVATADLFPSLTGNGEASRSSNPNNAGFGAQIGALLRELAGDTLSGGEGGGPGEGDEGEGSDRFTNTNYSASLGLAWEVDLWGRARNDRSAALADLAASRDDLHAARLAVLSETIIAWFQWGELRRRIEVTGRIVDVLQERVALTETRYDRGLVTSFELYQIRQDLRNIQAGLPLLRAQLVDVRRRLALLAGRYPGEVDPLLETEGEPTYPANPIPAGIPADLLVQRPDVRAAERRMEATRFRVGARKAELFPSLSLTGSLGLQSSEADNLLDLSQWFSNLAAGLTAPLFQGGRLRANLDAAEARYTRQAVAYGRTVLTAVGEVETALAAYREERERWEFLRSQLDEAEASTELQAERYAAGVADYPDYLDALRTRLTVESTLSQASRDLALARLDVHRALGGSWTSTDPVRTTWADPFPPDTDEGATP